MAELINWMVDPLWYSHGNRITGQNFSFNERISKTNLLLQSKDEGYDCLIFGSSRVTLLKESSFKSRHCFNYSFSAGKIEEFVEYAKLAKVQGINPETVYVGVDSFNFSQKPVSEKTTVVDIKPGFIAYLSLDVLIFSVKTLLGFSPDPRYYNQHFESEVIDDLPQFDPTFFNNQTEGLCDRSKVAKYKELKAIFPDAEFVGYVPPVSAWNVVNEVYSRDLTDCTLQAFYQISRIYDEMYDFSIPSTTTAQIGNTYDGSHFYPHVQAQVSLVLQGKNTGFGIELDDYSLAEYEKLYKAKIKTFLVQEGQEERWQAYL
ncbi:hypothetical protein IQ268_19815 [Oculatella sp. LEGE 06141]|uniref:hypothetical protein n=1 Tax=Oculatella sp. LEGE 06141 TaxID=1828648 RepID=UPI0018820AC1|nr:hypothetical protein [Oculatella sp. LEGE 06141]MBE9180811.1 hypothetical protein [Oculatella sp. LEGE 06141]